MTKPNKNQAGITLFELMLVVAILAILAALAFPGIQEQRARIQINAAQEDLVQSLRKARSVAMSRATLATVTVAAATVTPTTTTPATITLSVADGSLQTQTQNLPASLTITNAAYIFSPAGTVAGAGTATLNTAITFSSIKPRNVDVSPVGNIVASIGP